MTTPWSLTDQQRADTVARIRANLASMSFFRGTPLPEAELTAESAKLEDKAYAIAGVQATVTNCHRPHAETLQAYISKLSQLVLEKVATGSSAGAAQPASETKETGHVDLSGTREFLTAQGAQEALASMLSGAQTITKIKFSTKSFGAEAAEVAAEAIARVSGSLTHADMADIIAGRPEEEALRALRIIAAALSKADLLELDLSDNALGEKGIRAAAAAFAQQTTLERLAFRNVGCSVYACAALDELLPSPTTLRALSLYNNMSGDEGAAHIARLVGRTTALEEFSMVSSRVGTEGGVALLEALTARGATLTSLDLHDNPITEEAIPSLLGLLRAAGNLRHLNLTDTGLGDEGTATVLCALRDAAPPLESLHLALNELAHRSAAALAEVLPHLPLLRELDIGENELESAGLITAAKGIAHLTKLESLDVSGNQVRRQGTTALLAALASATGLKALGLDENELSEGAIAAIKSALASRGQAFVLGSLEDNMEPSDDEEEEEEEEGEGGQPTLPASDEDALAAGLTGLGIQ